MNAVEIARLCALVSSLCPQQAMEPATDTSPGTAAVWLPILGDLRFADAVTALQRIAKRQKFIAPSDIVQEVKQLRAERLDAVPIAARPTPNVDPANARGYQAEIVAIASAIADGRMGPDHFDAYRTSGRTLSGAPAMLAIEAGETVTRPLDLSALFAAVPRPAAQRKAAQDDTEARAKAQKALDEWTARKAAILAAKGRARRKARTP